MQLLLVFCLDSSHKENIIIFEAGNYINFRLLNFNNKLCLLLELPVAQVVENQPL